MFGHNSWAMQGQIDKEAAQRRKAHLTSVRARLQLQQRVERLEDDLARMGLLTLALANLCVDKGVLTADEVKARMAEIDLADGVEDGKAGPDAAGLAGA